MLHEIRDHPRGNIGHDLASPPDSRTVPSLPNRSQLIGDQRRIGAIEFPSELPLSPALADWFIAQPFPTPLDPLVHFFPFLLHSFVVLNEDALSTSRLVRRRKIRNPSSVASSLLPKNT